MEQECTRNYKEWVYDKPHDKILVTGQTARIEPTPNVTVLVAGQSISFTDPAYMRYVADALMAGADWLNSKGAV